MIRTFEQFISAAKRIALTVEERLAAKAALIEHMRRAPVRRAPRLFFFSWLAAPDISSNARTARSYAAVAMILVIAFSSLGGGVVLAAQGSLPDEPLYPVKIGVNESIRGLFAFSPEAKAEWDAERASERLREAERLAARGRLTPELREKIEVAFTQHADRLNEQIALLRAAKNDLAADEAESKIRASARAHKEIVREIAVSSRDTKELAVSGFTFPEDQQTIGVSTVPQIEESVGAPMAAPQVQNGPFDVTQGERSGDTGTAGRQTSQASFGAALTMRKKADEAIERAGQRIATHRKQEADLIENGAERSLQEARSAFAEGERLIDEQSYESAASTFREAFERASEALILLDAQKDSAIREKIQQNRAAKETQE